MLVAIRPRSMIDRQMYKKQSGWCIANSPNQKNSNPSASKIFTKTSLKFNIDSFCFGNKHFNKGELYKRIIFSCFLMHVSDEPLIRRNLSCHCGKLKETFRKITSANSLKQKAKLMNNSFAGSSSKECLTRLCFNRTHNKSRFQKTVAQRLDTVRRP